MLLTTYEAAAQLGISDRTVRKRIREGQLPAAKLGQMWVLDPAVISKIPRGRMRAGRSKPPGDRRLTVSEAAAQLGITRAALYNKIYRGLVSASRETGLWLVEPESIARRGRNKKTPPG